MKRKGNSAVLYLVISLIISALMIMPSVQDVIASLGKVKTESSLTTKNETTDSFTKAKVAEEYGKIPLHFIKNDGQIDKRVKYYEKGSGHAMYFTEDGVYLVLSRSNKEREKGSKVTTKDVEKRGEVETKTVRLTFKNGRAKPEVIAEGELEGKVNYFIGNDPKKWRTDIPTYRSVLYKEVYKGIDIRFYGNQRQIEYDVIVKPGAEPRDVRLAYEGIDGLVVNERGELEVYVKVYVKDRDGKREIGLIQRKPIVYQEVGGERREVEGRFEVVKRDRAKRSVLYAFKVGDYDKTRPLIIDPVLVYSTYLGGSSYEESRAIAVDSSGNAYVTGFTLSTNFSIQNAYQGTSGGGYDAFVTKLSLSGSPVYSTYLGGSSNDEGYSIAVDSLGNAYLTGHTYSTNFPIQNAIQWANRGYADVFITKLSLLGSLVYSTYFGGRGDDESLSIAYDGVDNYYVTGKTKSSDFPTQNAFQETHRGGIWDVFVIKLSESSTDYTVTVFKTGTGSGTVTSSPSGINCGSTCSASFNSGTSVTLTATPASGSVFGGWGGACSGTSPTCTVTMDGAKSVTTTFNAQTCTYSINPTSAIVSESNATGSITVNASSSSCSWTAQSNASWISNINPSSSTGSATVTYSVSANPTGSGQRTGTITVAGQTFTVTQTDTIFNDVSSSNTFYNYIMAIYNNGITVGCSQDPLAYCPSQNVTRGQMAAFIIRAKYGENFSYTQRPYYSDVPSSHDFFKYVQKLRDDGITVVTGTYCVNSYVTREMMSAFISRAFLGMQ